MSAFAAPTTITLTAAGTTEVTGSIPTGAVAAIVVCTMSASAAFSYPSYSIGFTTGTGGQYASGMNPGYRTTGGTQQGSVQWSTSRVGFASQSGSSTVAEIEVTTFGSGTIGLTKNAATQNDVTCTVYPIIAAWADVTLGEGVTTSGTVLTKTGLASAPGALFYIASGLSSASTGNGPRLNFGMAASATDEWGVGVSQQWNVNPSNCVSRVLTDRIGPYYRDGFTYAGSQFAVSSFTSDGYVIEQVNSSNQLGQDFAILAIPGTFALLTGDVPSSTGTEATTGAGFAPTSAFFALAAYATTNNTEAAGISLSLGAGTAAAQRYARIQTPDNTSTPQPTVAAAAGAVMQGADGSGQTSLAAIDSFDSDGFTLDWTDGDATAGLWAVLVSQAAAPSGPAFRSYYITG